MPPPGSVMAQGGYPGKGYLPPTTLMVQGGYPGTVNLPPPTPMQGGYSGMDYLPPPTLMNQPVNFGSDEDPSEELNFAMIRVEPEKENHSW